MAKIRSVKTLSLMLTFMLCLSNFCFVQADDLIENTDDVEISMEQGDAIFIEVKGEDETSAKELFTDITDSVIKESAVTLNELNVINGYPDGTFGADNFVTRGEYAAMLVRALSLVKPDNIPATPFADVPMNLWSFEDIITVDESKIMTGYGNGDFGPNDTITYEQAIKSLISALGYDGAAKYRGGYPWGYALVGAEKGLSKEVNCSVGDVLTRGDIAVILSNALHVETTEGDTFYTLLQSDMDYYYVSPNGNDSNPGTARKPWKTFYYAASVAKPGSEIIFEDGTYREEKRVEITVSGTEEEPIVFTARNNGQAKFIFGEDAKLGAAVFITKGADYITINGLDISQSAKADPNNEQYPTRDIILELEGDHCKITNNILHNAYEEGLKVTKNYDTLIENNIVYGFDHEGFDIFGVDRLIARNNEIYDCGRVLLMAKGNTRNSVFSNNYLHNKSVRCDTAITVGGSSNNTSPYNVGKNTGWENYNSVFYNNVICSDSPGLIDAGIAFWGAKDPAIFNNIVVGTKYGIYYKKMASTVNGWEWDTPTVSPVVRNNIFYECERGSYMELMPDGGIESSHNVYYKCGNPPKETGSIYDDPKFVDAYSDWHVSEDSPIKDMGVEMPAEFEYYDLGVESPNRHIEANGNTYKVEQYDIEGNPRTGKWDMGIYNIE